MNPEQLAGYLKKQRGLSLHHERVYQLVYEDKARGGDLYRDLRIVSKGYGKRYGSDDTRGKIPNRVSIDDRPAVVDKRSKLGDWEGGTVIGKGRKSALLTLVERKSVYATIVRLSSK